MGQLRDELADPWGVVVAGIVGGVAGVLPGAGLLVGVGVGAAVYGVKVATGLLLGSGRPQQPAPLRPADGTPAAFWLARAAHAVEALDDMARGPATSPTDVAAQHAAQEADGVLETMRRLGGQSAAVARALRQAEAPGLDDEAAELRRAAVRRPEDPSAQQSAQAVEDRLAVRDRLRKASAALDGRLQSSALGLEGLVARVAELRATASAAGQVDPTADDLASLTSEVEGLRVGLADVEQVARRALGSAPS
jgi:hypothetical protein